MATLPILTGIVGGIFISETYRYIQSWFINEDKSSITINIGTQPQDGYNTITNKPSNSTYEHPVMIPTINEENLFSQLQNFDQRNLTKVTPANKQMSITLMDDLKKKLNERRINLAICNE